MGSALSSQMKGVMDENMKNQQAFMLESYEMQLERQISMQNEMRERQMAMGIGRAREIFKYYGTFYATAALVGSAAFLKTKKPAAIAPLIPLSFILAFQYDAAYGNLMQRVRAEAEGIMVNERDMLNLPYNLPTFEQVEKARLARK